ncbi:MAG: translation elongation factor Ts [Acidimicrobiia bacterium]
MADVSAKDVAALRKATGAGMMDCKNALAETDGDLEAAKEYLRKKGLAGAAKRAGRGGSQGAVDVQVDGTVGALVELTCETDFVAKGTDFSDTLTDLVNLVVEKGIDSGDALAAVPYGASTVGEEVTQMAARLGEDIQLGRVSRISSTDGVIDAYKHVQADRGVIGVLVELTGNDRELAHDVALHIASAAPRYLSRDDVPSDVVEKERDVLTELTRNEGKPESALEKIVEGRIGGFFKEICLLEQGYVKDPKVSIAKLLDERGASVKQFVRVKVGEE